MMAYYPPLSLTILGAIFLLVGLTGAIVVLGDIILRKAWRSMMLIMIPVYSLTCLYLGPVGVAFYFKYGRPQVSTTDEKQSNQEDQNAHQMQGHDHHHNDSANSFWVTVFAGVTHCGAGCVLGDIVGEWLVFGVGARINGEHLWPEMLIDYSFALLFGVVFQYLSIAPMSGQWGPATLIRALKADVLSLTSFEIGLFGWMAAFQAGIWDYRLPTVSTTYWWMMQVGMALGFATAFPVNWFLIKAKIKEPCV